MCGVLQKGVVMTVKLVAPMTEELVWANVMRPRIPLVYLDMNTIIYIARALAGNTAVPRGYAGLYEAARRAKLEQRAMFPLSEEHLWEMMKIASPKQRRDLADVFETLSEYNYLMGRTLIGRLEFEAGIAKIMGEDASARSLPLIRQTFGHAFGFVGGMKIRDNSGRDVSDAVRAEMSDPEFNKMMATMNYEMERSMLQGPSDEDLEALRADPNYRPEVALESQESRLQWELDTKRVLGENPRFLRGRLRDAVSGREMAHEWLETLSRMRVERIEAGLPEFAPSDEEMRSFLGSLPHVQVAISIKTKYHQNPQRQWTVNDVVDIDAMSVAYAYCEAVFPDKAMRSALQNSKELRAIDTFVPRRPEELAQWLDNLPTVVVPDLLIPHPIPRLISQKFAARQQSNHKSQL